MRLAPDDQALRKALWELTSLAQDDADQVLALLRDDERQTLVQLLQEHAEIPMEGIGTAGGGFQANIPREIAALVGRQSSRLTFATHQALQEILADLPLDARSKPSLDASPRAGSGKGLTVPRWLRLALPGRWRENS